MNSNILNIVNIVTIFLWVSLVHIVFSDKKNKKGNLSLFLILSLSIFLSNCDSPTDESSHPCNDETSTQVKEGPLAVGCPNANYPDWETSPYVLPYPVGECYSIDLSNCSGSFHNEGRPDQFAIDFDMKIGTLITASRAGVVVHVVENGIDGSHPTI